MPKREQTPGEYVQPIRFHGLSCRYCLNETPHPGDLDRLPDSPPGSVWAVLMEDLD